MEEAKLRTSLWSSGEKAGCSSNYSRHMEISVGGNEDTMKDLSQIWDPKYLL